jgi:hypothetical protein
MQENTVVPQAETLSAVPSREQLVHSLYEAAELEHTLMCTYLYAAFSLRSGEAEGLSAEEAAVVAGWRKTIVRVAIDEMGHLTAIWNITSARGGAPRFGRDNFPVSAGALPAGVVVRLEPFSEAVLQHFIYLERPHGADQHDGAGFEREFKYLRAIDKPRLTPMPLDYDTVGVFYETLSARLRLFVAHHGEQGAFCGNAGLQLSEAEVQLSGAKTVICLKTALAAFKAIIEQGEGAPADAEGSHYQRFLCIQREYAELKAKNANFEPAYRAAINPVLRRPTVAAGRIWIEDEDAAVTVDIANTAYMLMLRLLAYSYSVPHRRTHRHAPRARRTATRRPGARRTVPGARQPRAAQWDGAHGLARHQRAPVSLRWQQHQAVLRQHPSEERLPLAVSVVSSSSHWGRWQTTSTLCPSGSRTNAP